MAQELIKRTWCDVCLADERHTEAETYSLVIDGRKASADLCATHARPIGALVKVLDGIDGWAAGSTAAPRVAASTGAPDRRGNTSTSTPPIPAGLESLARTCPDPACGFVSASRAALNQHVRHTHGVPSISDFEVKHGRTDWVCWLCDTAPRGTYSALIQHVRAAHGRGVVEPVTGDVA